MGQNDSAAKDSAEKIVRMVRSSLPGLVLISGFMNLLLLGVVFFVILAGDVIMPSRNVATLVGLFLLTAVFCLFYGGLGLVRARLLNDLAGAAQVEMADAVHDGVQFIARSTGGSGDGLQPVRDMGTVHGFLAGPTSPALLDLPWTLLGLIFLFVLHFWLGAVTLLCLLAVGGSLYWVEQQAQKRVEDLASVDDLRLSVAEEDRRNAHVLRGLGMESRLRSRWKSVMRHHLKLHRHLAGSTTDLQAISQAARLFMLVTVITVGVALTFDDKASIGLIMGGAILLFQMLAPAERAAAGWGEFMSARQAWNRINLLLPSLTRRTVNTVLPRPTAEVVLEPVAVLAPGGSMPVLQNVGFQLDAGDALGVVGPTGAGKTALLRVLSGAWRPARGTLRFDGATIDQWDLDDLGRYIGYLPQTVELMHGTVAQNIARFDANATSEQIIAAAQAAGAHEHILRLPAGYETEVGRDGQRLSGGSRQRIGLARALFGDPFLVLLDEPGSNLDGEGEQAMIKAIVGVRERRGIAVVVSQRPSILSVVEDIMVLREGTMAAFGPRAQVMNSLVENRANVKITSLPGEAGKA